MNAAELRIRTPEGITFAYQLAGPVTRCLAWIIDLTTVFALCLAVTTGMAAAGALSPDLAQASAALALFVVPVAYGIALEWLWRGQTVGKKILRLRVMDADGLRLQFHQVLMRNLVRFADLLPGPYLVGGLACLLSPKAQRLGDLAAGTIVVHHRKPLEPDLEQLLGTKFNSLRAQPHLCARLRQRTSPDEARLALQALMRRDEFDPAARVQLFAEMAAHFKALAHFPTELLEAMPDEQFVRNVVDVLFRTSEVKPRVPEMVTA
jgi:uncharacterized RDD family membrane protein YckC